MGQMNSSEAQIVDPILTTHAQGYKQADLVGHELFPAVPVDDFHGQVIEFGLESFHLYNSIRAAGSDTKEVQFGYEGKPYSLVQDAIEGKVPRERLKQAQRAAKLDMGKRTVRGVMRIMKLRLEYDQSQMARDPNNYDADHKADFSAAKWTDDNNDPIADIKAAQEAIRRTTGVRGNKLVLSPVAFTAIQNNAKVMERFKYTKPSLVTLEDIRAACELKKVVVGDAITADKDKQFSDVWGKDAVLAYVSEQAADQDEPSYGYTYTMRGHPIAEPSYLNKGNKSYMYPVTYERKPVLSGMLAGYLFRNVA